MNLFEDLLSHYVLQEAISLKNAKKHYIMKVLRTIRYLIGYMGEIKI